MGLGELLERAYDGIRYLLSPSERELARLGRATDEVNAYADEMRALTDDGLRGKTEEFRKRYAAGETLDDLLPEAYAAVREASARATGKRPYDVQVMGAVVLHEGRIAEMQTGEGKTLVATMPAYLHAIEGKGVHVITSNDYLAKRDADDMGRVYGFMGLSVGVIQNGQSPEERRGAYAADVTYGTCSEFGFDHLRDNMARSVDERVMRKMHYAIVDEVDSILIDEGRTPLIISGRTGATAREYQLMDSFVRALEEGRDFEVMAKDRVSVFTDRGYDRLCSALGVDLADERLAGLAHAARQCLQARTLFKRDKDYVVSGGDVLIVDEFTGRLMHGRRYEAGLHEALEAKEANEELIAKGSTEVRVREPSQTYASITFPNLFKLYDRISGMTGTAKTEEGEFISLYGMDVVQVPTNRPLRRTAGEDRLYRTEAEKYAAIVDDIASVHSTGRPILVGTRSIEASERLSALLRERGIGHEVLHAKHHEREAAIVAQAGQYGAVTIATNMAGRGTDIKLGEGVAELGGLHVIGTERHESRRIDDQLLGRSGRQGDPGSSQFYLSCEDELIRFHGPSGLDRLYAGLPEGQPLSGRSVDRMARSAQRKVEGMHFDMRKHLLEYDEVMNKHREVFYGDRNAILERSDLGEDVLSVIERVAGDVAEMYTAEGRTPDRWTNEFLRGQFEHNLQALFGLRPGDLPMDRIKDADSLKAALQEKALERYREREAMFPDAIREVERQVLLYAADNGWRDHLLAMDELKDGVGLRAYAQKDPKIEYQHDAFDLFRGFQDEVRWQAVRALFHFTLTPREEGAQGGAQGQAGDGAPAGAPEAGAGQAGGGPTPQGPEGTGPEGGEAPAAEAGSA